jgi:PhzF family phenazine biosynthesis protein
MHLGGALYLGSMEFDLYQVDAFTSEVFGGNPACVMPLDEWLPDDVLLSLAQENAVAETAFLVAKGDRYHLRWFTPDLEMDLCGHATLASAHVVLSHLHPGRDEVTFDTMSGALVVTRCDRGYEMVLPNRFPEPSVLPMEIEKAASIPPSEVHKSRDYLLVYPREKDVQEWSVNRELFDLIDLGTGGVIVTAPGDDCDFVSRYFTPQATMLEDPVTGSAHCSSAPFWAERLGKSQLHAKQLSARGGDIRCQVMSNHVLISGNAVTYLTGTVHLKQTCSL